MDRERWWYRLVQVCRRWRYIVLESASHLRLSLVCVRGTPVADMLAHSPPLPLIIDHTMTNIMTSPQKTKREYSLRCSTAIACAASASGSPIPILQRLVNALDGEFPILEYLLIMHQRYQRPTIEHNMTLKLPETFRAPHLRHLLLDELCHSNRISITHDYGEPCHSVAQPDPTLRLLPPECFTPTPLTHASAGDTRDLFQLPFSQP
jgi:hypothetical protein